MAPTLPDLPVELVERVVDYIPYRDTLLQLRLASRILNAKTMRRFGKAYFNDTTWSLKSTTAKGLIHFSNIPEVASHVDSIALISPYQILPYEDFWVAKGLDAVKISVAVSQFTQLRKLELRRFGLNDKKHKAFIHDFIEHLSVQKLESLSLGHDTIDSQDLIRLLERHKQTLKHVTFETLNLIYELDPEMPGYETPWSDVLWSMEKFKNNCEITIEQPEQSGEPAALEPPWEDWEPPYEYKGLTIDLLQDDEDLMDMMGDTRLWIHIKGDSDWWKGVKRISYLYSWPIKDPDRDKTPLWEELSDSDWYEKEREKERESAKAREAAKQKQQQKKKNEGAI